jgi:hypothetical protein
MHYSSSGHDQITIYLETQMPIDNQTNWKVEFYRFNLLGVLAMDHVLKVAINCWIFFHWTYKITIA